MQFRHYVSGITPDCTFIIVDMQELQGPVVYTCIFPYTIHNGHITAIFLSFFKFCHNNLIIRKKLK